MSKTLAELETIATADLKAPTKEAQLRWVFWHAGAVGRLKVAEAVLKRFEQRDWEVCARASVYMPDTQQHAMLMAQRPEAEVKRAETLVIEEASAVEATRQILALLGRAGERATAAPASTVVPASRPLGQASQTRTNQPSHGAEAMTSTTPPQPTPAPNGQQGRGR